MRLISCRCSVFCSLVQVKMDYCQLGNIFPYRTPLYVSVCHCCTPTWRSVNVKWPVAIMFAYIYSPKVTSRKAAATIFTSLSKSLLYVPGSHKSVMVGWPDVPFFPGKVPNFSSIFSAPTYFEINHVLSHISCRTVSSTSSTQQPLVLIKWYNKMIHFIPHWTNQPFEWMI